MGKARNKPSNLEAELSAEIVRLNALLRQAADARTVAENTAADAAIAIENAAATEFRHAREIGEERARTSRARADTQAMADKAASDARISRSRAAAAEARHGRELDEERASTAAARGDATELHHRIKNTFATVQAIANATLRPDVPYEDARAAFNSRLAALARVHDLLFRRDWSGATLKSLVDSIVAPHAGTRSRRLRVRGVDVDIGPRSALLFGLALNELATNALKYGALSNGAGYVEITWTRAKEVRLRWRERNGPPVTPPSRKGFGSRLIVDSLTVQLKAAVELEFNSRGLICTIGVPANALLME